MHSNKGHQYVVCQSLAALSVLRHPRSSTEETRHPRLRHSRLRHSRLRLSKLRHSKLRQPKLRQLQNCGNYKVATTSKLRQFQNCDNPTTQESYQHQSMASRPGATQPRQPSAEQSFRTLAVFFRTGAATNQTWPPSS